MIMNTLSLIKYAAVATIAGAAVMAPVASFAGSPFVFGGPGYQPPVHSTSSPGSRAFASAQVDKNLASHRYSGVNCMRAPFSDCYEPCY
jgi:hypothetical protein